MLILGKSGYMNDKDQVATGLLSRIAGQLSVAFAILLGGVPQHAGADVSSGVTDWFSIHGFGTFAGTRTSDPSVGYRAYPQNSAKGGAWAFDADSLLGLQFDLAQQSDLSGTIQVIDRKRETSSFDPEIEWAFVKYQIFPEWRVRIGRVLTPVFMDSESRFVGYANTAVRPNTHTFTSFPLSNHDGADLAFRHLIDNGVLSLTAYYGASKLDLPANSAGDLSYKADSLYGFTAAWESESLKLWFSHVQTDIRISGSGTASYRLLQNGLSSAASLGCASCSVEAVKLGNLLENTGYQLTNIGVRQSLGDWVLSGELAESQQKDSALQVGKAALFQLAYAMNQWTPYLLAGRTLTTQNNQAAISANDIATVGLPGPHAAMLAYNALLTNQNNSRSTQAVGMRWDAIKNVAVKAELMHVHLDSPSGNPFSFPAIPGPAPGAVLTRTQSFNVMTLTCDFVF
jgi:hypothetical protein